MKIALVAATGLRGELGYNGALPWRIKEDLRFFKNLTEGNVLVMGRKTFESIGKPLPNRTTIVLTNQEGYKAEGCIVMHSVADVMKYGYKSGLDNLYIAGGGEIYRHFLPLADLLYLTVVQDQFKADAFFDPVNHNDWELRTERDSYGDGYDYKFTVWERKGNKNGA